jgi:DNA-binding transcriptional MocR family regulator
MVLINGEMALFKNIARCILDEGGSMILKLNRTEKIPLYQQIKRSISRLIQDGLLPPGNKLPASRELALSIGVSRNTVVQAYQELEAEGVITSHVGKGAFISHYLPFDVSSFREGKQTSISYEGLFSSTWLRSNTGMPAVLEQLAQPQEQQKVLSLATDLPDHELLPLDEFRDCLLSAFRRFKEDLLISGSPQGFEPFLDYLPIILARRNILCNKQNLMVVSGLQQALSLVARLFLDPGDTILLENLTYPGALGVFRSLQVNCIGLPLDTQGLCIDVLKRVLRHRNAKLLYTIPTFHNPTGTTMATERRVRLVDLCREHNLIILEDDYAHDLSFEGRESVPLKAWDSCGGIIHVGSFSESMFPGIRLSWIVASEPIIERLSLLKQSSDLYTNRILQAALLEFCRRGYYERNVKRKRQVYKKRRDRMIETMKYQFPEEIRWQKPNGGLFQWVDIPPRLDALSLLLETRKKGVVFAPDRMFAVEGWKRDGFRLGFVCTDEGQIEKGIGIIGETMKEMLDSASHT